MMDIQFAYTMDFDWASEAVIEYSLQQFIESDVPITLFATHNSEYVNRLSVQNKNLEIEIHPNFCRNSTHGKSEEEIFACCNNIISERKGFRCHRFYSSNDVQEYYKRLGYLYSSNICADLEYVKPFRNRVGLLEIPIFMEDGGFLFQGHRIKIDDVVSRISRIVQPDGKATIVFLFHPMHMAFNTVDFAEMKNFKQSMSIQTYRTIAFEDIVHKRQNKYGISNLVEDIHNWSEANSIKKVLLKDVYNEWQTIRV